MWAGRPPRPAVAALAVSHLPERGLLSPHHREHGALALALETEEGLGVPAFTPPMSMLSLGHPHSRDLICGLISCVIHSEPRERKAFTN